jgi:predicted nucleic acid-binding Zn ribbon protein
MERFTDRTIDETGVWFMKLINYKCLNCGHEDEVFEDEQVKKDEEFYNSDAVLICSKCTGMMVKFNFKNNGQRWRFCDAE